jgi:hypothetical protein
MRLFLFLVGMGLILAFGLPFAASMVGQRAFTACVSRLGEDPPNLPTAVEAFDACAMEEGAKLRAVEVPPMPRRPNSYTASWAFWE